MANRGPFYKRFLDFSGGQNDTVSELKLAKNEAGRARNVDLDRDGAFTKRKGASVLIDTLAAEVGMIHQVRPSAGLIKNLIAYGDRIAEWDLGLGVVDLVTGLTANRIVLPVPFRNLTYLSNGIDPMMVYYPGAPSAPYIWRAGTPQPAALSKNTDIAGAMTAGTILVRVRFVSVIDDTFIGEPFPEEGLSVTVTASGGVRMNIPVYAGGALPVDYRVAKRMIERTTVGGGTFIIDGFAPDNVATTYDIIQSDAALNGNLIAPDVGFRLPMPLMYPFIRYENRILGADVADLGSQRWSEIDEHGILPEAFPDENQIYLDIEDMGDTIQALSQLGDLVISYCGRSIHQMNIDEGGIGYRTRLGGHKLGFPNARCVAEIPGGNLIWSLKGPYFFNLGDMIFIGERIAQEISLIPKATLANMYTVHRSQEQRRQVKFVFPTSGSAQNNVAAKYHYRRVTLNPEGFPTAHAWTFDDGFLAKSGAIFLDSITNEETEYSGDYLGTIYREDALDADQHNAGGAIAMEWATAWLDMDSPEAVKDFEDIWVVVTGDSPHTLVVTWETNFGAGVSGTATLSLGAGEALWDSALWDVDVWPLGASKIIHAQLANDGVCPVGRLIRFRFTNNNANEPVTVVGFIVKYSIDSDRDEQAIV